MAKYKLQELTDMRNEGKRRVYPKMVTNRTLSRKEFIKRMQGYHRGISESTTEAVLLDVADMLVEMLSMGYNVNLEGIGTFSLSLGFEDDKPTEMQSEEDKMTYRKVGVKDINFKASPEFIKENWKIIYRYDEANDLVIFVDLWDMRRSLRYLIRQFKRKI